MTTSWFKSLYMSPFNYGLTQLNNVVMNALTIFLNNYGNKLFKIETEIIKESKCVDNMDVFYLYPIYIENHVSQLINFNLITFKEGIIDGITISFPWKTLLSTLTIVKIESIDLTISIEKKLPVALNKSIYDINTENDIDLTNQDLIIAYDEISNIIQQYFKSISIEIESIKIKIENLHITMINIIYCDKILSIGKICIQSSIIANIKYNMIQSTIHISHMSIDTAHIIEYLPQIYLSDELSNDNSSNEEITIHVDELQIDDIQISNFKFTIKSNTITVLNLKELIIPNIIKIYTELKNMKSNNNCIFSYNKINSIVNFKSIVHICLIDPTKLENYFSYLNNLFNQISGKIITHNSSPDKKKPLIIENANIMLAFFPQNSFFSIKINEIICFHDKIISVSELTILDIDNNVRAEISNLNINPTHGLKDQNLIKIELDNLSLQSKSFNMKSANIIINKLNHELEFILTDTYTTEIILLVDYIKSVLELCKSSKDTYTESKNIINNSSSSSLLSSTIKDESDIANTDLSIKIHIKNSSFSIIHPAPQINAKYNFEFEIKSGCIYVTDKIGTNIDLNVSIDGDRIGALVIDCVDSESINISDCKFFLDPDMFDQLNYLFGTLIPSSMNDVDIQKSQQSMFQSITADSIEDLEFTMVKNNTDNVIDDYELVSATGDEPVIKLLLNSISDLHNIVINSYCDVDNNKYDLKIHIKTISIHLFDDISKDIILTDSFLCIILNELDFSKLSTIDSKTLSKNIKYTFKISKGYAIDMASSDTRWKYFFKSANGDNLVNGLITTHDDLYKIKIDLGSLLANIREETLLRLLGFFSNSHQLPSSMKKDGSKSKSTSFIEIFNISGVDISVNFLPLILKNNNTPQGLLAGVMSSNTCANMLSLKDFKIKLRSQYIKSIDGFDTLLEKITNVWTTDVNMDNVLQFVPNINIIQPYASGFTQIVKLVNKYFESDYNRQKLREVTKHINYGIDFVTYFLKMGYDQVITFFETNIATIPNIPDISIPDIKLYLGTISKYQI